MTNPITSLPYNGANTPAAAGTQSEAGNFSKYSI